MKNISVKRIDGTTIFIYADNEQIGTINSPAVSSEKPYHAIIKGQKGLPLGANLDEHEKHIFENSFKTENEAIEHIIKSVRNL